jgi:hypothetical protein
MRDALDSSNHKGDVLSLSKQHEDHKGFSLKSVVLKIFSPENIWAFLLFLIVIALIIFTTDNSPIWIYQGF